MALELSSIRFNHDPAGAATSALNIRRNKDFEVQFPEYDASLARQDSRAAYSIADTAHQSVVIRLEFTDNAAASYDVRATGGGVLGQIDPFSVTLSAAGTVTVDVTLDKRSFAAVTREDVTWSWSFRNSGTSAWTPLVTTQHRIYLLLAAPGAPWTQTYADKRNPWTDLLDVVCNLASGAKSADAATAAVVKQVNQSYSLRYDIFWGAPSYGFHQTTGSFQLTEWIEYVLGGQPPATPLWCSGQPEEYRKRLIVNCYDCAAAVTIMSTVLGAPVVHQYHSPFGKLRYIAAIGRGKSNNPFPGCSGTPTEVSTCNRTGFGNHAYARLAGLNFDACMREWLSPITRFILILIWLIILIVTFGMVNRRDLLDRAGGWLIRLSQATYDSRTIDAACSPSTGSPIDVNTQFTA